MGAPSLSPPVIVPIAMSVDKADAFEAIIQQQTPNRSVWQPVTGYSLEERRLAEGRHPALLQEIFPETQRVIDIGCHRGQLLAMLTFPVQWGIDRDPPPMRERYWPQIIEGDVGRRGWGRHAFPFASRSFDLVICREVFEHLTLLELRWAVTNLNDVTSRYVYVTMRLHPAATHVLDVATSDDLDPTHCTLPHPDLIRALFALEGLRRCRSIEDHLDWQHQGRVFVYERQTV